MCPVLFAFSNQHMVVSKKIRDCPTLKLSKLLSLLNHTCTGTFIVVFAVSRATQLLSVFEASFEQPIFLPPEILGRRQNLFEIFCWKGDEAERLMIQENEAACGCFCHGVGRSSLLILSGDSLSSKVSSGCLGVGVNQGVLTHTGAWS